jgi:hypothetical protein
MTEMGRGRRWDDDRKTGVGEAVTYCRLDGEAQAS